MAIIRKKGFSLVELMVVITVMVILAMVASSFFTFYYKEFAESRLTKLQKLIEYSIVRARTDHVNVIICPASSNSFTKGILDEKKFSCLQSASWADNPIVSFESSDTDDNYDVNDDTIIANLPQGHQGNIYVTFGNLRNHIRISPDGFFGRGQTAGHITYCDRSNEYQAALVMNISGRLLYTESETRNNVNLSSCQ